MKSSRIAVALVGLTLVGLWYFAGGTNPLPASRAAEAQPRVATPLAHENLSVYFVYGPDAVADVKLMSLQEALDRDLAVVHETGNVNTLAIENLSPEYELFVQSGDIVKGGRQDRMVQYDMLVPPRSGVVPMPAHCVEQGRWSGRGGESSGRFSSSAKCAAGKELKYANYAGQQAAVWDNVKRNQDKLNDNLKSNVNADASPTSFQLTLEANALVAKVTEYETALRAAGEDRDNIIGVVFVVNGQISGAEVYGSNALFRKAWPKLLNAAAVEAIGERDARVASAPSAREVERFLAHSATAHPAAAGSPTDSTEDPVAVRLQAMNRSLRINANDEMVQLEGRRISGDVVVTDGRQQIELDRPVPSRPEPAPNPQGQAGAEFAGRSGATREALVAGGAGAARPAVVLNPGGNRLSSNRTESQSTLVVESRDAGRAGAFIHRSYTPAPSAPSAQPARPAQPAPAANPSPARP